MTARSYRGILWLLYGSSLTVWILLLWRGLPYYLTPLAERPRHPAYWQLKPAGETAYWYAIVGSALMIVMQSYSLRKRARLLRELGTVRGWLDFHIYCGVMGPLLIVLHSSFKVHGLVALSFWSMVIVAVSGIVGRYLYLQIPRRRSGDEMTLRDLEESNRELAQRLRRQFGLEDEFLSRLDALAIGHLDRLSLAALVVRLPFEGLRLRRQTQRLLRELSRRPPGSMRELARLTRQKARLESRIRILGKLQELFHYWHVLHKPFAVIMYLFMFVHIGVALLTGYAWKS